jgi:hypothetical protein
MQAKFCYKKKKINVITLIFYNELSTKLNSELLIKTAFVSEISSLTCHEKC